MSKDLTPKELAEKLCDGLKVFFGHDPPHPYGDKECLICRNITTSIRNAAAAQKERCVKANPMGIECPYCSQGENESCRRIVGHTVIDTFHNARWRAAIRRGGEPDDGSG